MSRLLPEERKILYLKKLFVGCGGKDRRGKRAQTKLLKLIRFRLWNAGKEQEKRTGAGWKGRSRMEGQEHDKRAGAG
jgi:hypothetical protein